MVKAEPVGSSRDLGNSSLALESKSFPTAWDDFAFLLTAHSTISSGLSYCRDSLSHL